MEKSPQKLHFILNQKDLISSKFTSPMTSNVLFFPLMMMFKESTNYVPLTTVCLCFVVIKTTILPFAA